jgi:hypothetical protein
MNNHPHYTPPNAVLAGIMAFLPLLAVGIYLAIFFSFIFGLRDDLAYRTNNITDDNFPDYFVGLIFGALVMAALSLAALIYFLVIISKNPALTSDMRLVWILLTIFGGVIAHIVYFFMYVVPQSRGQQPLG